ncbi:hypothetical protein E1281_34610 [Actinomadura sp. KC345]|uniref:hypothetical protein n=1 Tax=Actinomadura sp. KC345 TaxID=2530371 RepID=UPI00105216E5|nr:hypothetical protein [Actinomadura sp. KC345]TDC44018.1 hypothetical protein E1281_34610 [Actinomadura sp. KC345]
MKCVTAINVLSNGFRRLWRRTKRGLAVIVSGCVAGALVGGVLFGVVPYLVLAAHGFTPGFEVVIPAFVENMVGWGILSAVGGTLVLVLDDNDLLSALAVGLGLIGLPGGFAGLIADGLLVGAPGTLICELGFTSVIVASAIIAGGLVYALVYDD